MRQSSTGATGRRPHHMRRFGDGVGLGLQERQPQNEETPPRRRAANVEPLCMPHPLLCCPCPSEPPSGSFVGGCNDGPGVMSLNKQGKLVPLLKQAGAMG
jgi:hypothetical protein